MAAALIAKILLTILTAALFLLLAVLLILLLVLCLILFTPLKYSIYAEKYDAIKAEGKVSWLLGTVVFSFCYNDGKNSYKLKIFGADYKKLAGFLARFFKKKESYDLEAAEETINNKSKEESYEKKKEKNLPGNKNKTPVKENKTDAGKDKTPQKNAEVEIRNKEDKKTVQNSQHNRADKDKRASRIVIPAVKAFWQKIKLIPVKIKKFKEKLYKIPEAVHKSTGKITKIKEFICSEITKNIFALAKDKFFYLLKKLRPRKIETDILIGTGDPCQTGQIIGAAAVYMAMSGTFFNITPDFENKILRGRIKVLGHIRAVTLLAAFLKVILSNEWKSFYKEAKKIKEEF